MKTRLDVLIVERGLVESREQARRLILAGQIEVAGVAAPKPGQLVRDDTEIRIKARDRYVSRGGYKLEAALQQFRIDPTGQACADIGASTGGFTDCLLQHGAARVYAVDVGASQIHERLRRDPRVVLIEHTNARQLDAGSLPELPTLIVMDVSFISVTKILPALRRSAAPTSQLVTLIKPQFEATRSEVSRGRGVIRNSGVHRRVLREIIAAAPTLGWKPHAIANSPIPGGSGNREFLIHLSILRDGDSPMLDSEKWGIQVDALVDNPCNGAV